MKSNDRADYIATDKEMMEHLANVTQSQSRQTIEIVKKLKQKVLNFCDTANDWEEANCAVQLQEFYKKKLFDLFFLGKR
jgi:hypothetical protein